MKFSSELDELLYQASLDGGPDEEVGDAQDFGWYGLMRLKPDDSDYFIDLADEGGWDDPEGAWDQLKGKAGAIIYEDSQGSVDVTYYATEDALNKAWDKILQEADEFYGEEGEEEEEEEEGEEEEEEEQENEAEIEG